MSALEDALRQPNGDKIVLAEVTAGKYQPVWTSDWSPYFSSPALSLWAEDLALNEGAAITSITDSVGKHRLNSTTAGYTTLSLVDADTERKSIIAKSAVRFSQLKLTPMSEVLAAEAGTFFIAIKKAVGFNCAPLSFSNDAGVFLFSITLMADKVVFQHGDTTNLTAPVGFDDGEWKILTIIRDGTTVSLRINGVEEFSDETIGTALSLTDARLNAFQTVTGGPGDTSAEYGGAWAYKTALSGDDLDGVESGLLSFYSVGEADPDTLWTVEEPERVVGVQIDGVDLEEADSVADCLATDDSFFWDGIRVYVNADDPRDWDSTTILTLKFFYSNESRVIGGAYYDGRITSIPSLTKRIEETFAGIATIGGGTIVFSNGDRYFDGKRAYRWDAGNTTLYLGCNYADYVMPLEDYEIIGTWANDSWSCSDDFTISLVEFRERIKKEIPTAVYTRLEYPNIHESHDGRSKQIIYGTCYGVAPVCIDVEAKKFKIASHAIEHLEAVRANIGGRFRSVVPTLVSLANAEFVYADWDGSQDVSCDVRGKTDTNGLLMDNASDIIKDILAQIGQTNIDAASFATAKAVLDRGYYIPSLRRVASFSPSVYLGGPESALDVISEINSIVGSYLFSDATGKFFYKVFEPQRVEGLNVLSEQYIKSIEVSIETADRVSFLHVKYAKRHDEGWAVDFLFERERNQRFRNENARIKNEDEVSVASRENATLYAHKNMIYRGELNEIYTLETTDAAMALWGPGDQFLLQFDAFDGSFRHDVVLEVYSIGFDPARLDVIKVLAGNRHGYGDRPGFWSDDDEVLPTRFASLAGYGSGSIEWNKAWHRRIKDFARKNYGYWTDDNGFADPTDPESFIPSIWV